MIEVFSIIIWILFGFACYKIAENQGRNVWLALVLGILFGIFAVIGYLIAGNKKKD